MFLERRGFIKFQSDIGKFFMKFWAILLDFIIIFLLQMRVVSFMERAILGIIFIYIYIYI